ncbi:hypothetical protein [Allosphingosinicella sp.]|uniref:hypothetical protein n=1 Tax=Allosphingosinicella sp. TaxID=2823234 RepID=UPI003D74A497
MLMALALAFSSVGMSSAMAAAPGHHVPAAGVHCADREAPAAPATPESGAAADCAIACSALAPLPHFIAEPSASTRAVPRQAAPAFLTGTSPESEPPPPRTA